MPYCSICGRECSITPLKVKPTFTAYSLLQAGDGICEICDKKLNDQWFRRHSWIEKLDGEYEEIQNGEELPILLDPPEPHGDREKPVFLVYPGRVFRRNFPIGKNSGFPGFSRTRDPVPCATPS